MLTEYEFRVWGEQTPVRMGQWAVGLPKRPVRVSEGGRAVNRRAAGRWGVVREERATLAEIHRSQRRVEFELRRLEESREYSRRALAWMAEMDRDVLRVAKKSDR